MNLITFLFYVLSFIISNISEFVYANDAMIVVTQGLIENENLLPISVYWYHPNFTQGDKLHVSFSTTGKKFAGSYNIKQDTGILELSRNSLVPNGSAEEYCSWIQTSNGRLNHSPSCKSKQQWMYDRRNVLGCLSLRDLLIPGTHESAAYIDDQSKNQTLFPSWIPCQTKSIRKQLQNGIRFLDLRPSSKEIDGVVVYMISHDTTDVISMEVVVKQIKEFMNSSKDIVIVSFREFFEGFYSNEDHLNFIAYLEFAFGEYILSRRSWTYTLNQIWATDRRLILSYDHDRYLASLYMWPPIRQYSNDVQTIARLYSDLDTLHHSHANDIVPYAVFIGLRHYSTTADHERFSMDMRSRYWAQRLGRHIPDWYINSWNSSANIIVVDFYQASGIVDVAIQWSERRAKHSCYSPKNSTAQST